MKVLIAFGAVLALAGCGGLSRDSSPNFSTSSSRPIMDVAACLVREADSRSIDRTGLGKTITHQIAIRQPGTVVEVQPIQSIIAGEEVYFAKISAAAAGSKIEVYSFANIGIAMIDAARACAGS